MAHDRVSVGPMSLALSVGLGLLLLAVVGVPTILFAGTCSGSAGVLDQQCIEEGKPPGCWRL